MDNLFVPDASLVSMTSTPTLISALRILSKDIQSGDGVANAAIAEAADRMEEFKDFAEVMFTLTDWCTHLDDPNETYEMIMEMAHDVLYPKYLSTSIEKPIDNGRRSSRKSVDQFYP